MRTTTALIAIVLSIALTGFVSNSGLYGSTEKKIESPTQCMTRSEMNHMFPDESYDNVVSGLTRSGDNYSILVNLSTDEAVIIKSPSSTTPTRCIMAKLDTFNVFGRPASEVKKSQERFENIEL